jgi:hypothetical protein
MRTYLLFAIWICATICACGSFSGTSTSEPDRNDGGIANKTVSGPTSDGSADTDGGENTDGSTDLDASIDSPIDAETSDACAPVTHNTGLGQQWTDCVPLGTYNLEQALKACAAYCTSISCTCIDNPGEASYCGNAEFVTTQNGTTAWQYQGSFAGYARPSTSSTCPGPPMPTWN